MSSQIPGYQIIKKVGEGGMSTVYLAIQFSVGREVALKVLSPELRQEKGFAERFYREANIVGALSHPNVISIFDAGKQAKHYYMSMDYLPGPSCKRQIADRQISPSQAIRILQDITKAANYVHQQGYLHCDIKPDNILFRPDGSAVLTDFGITRELHGQTQSGVAGTPHYMSPEQAQGKKLDARSDIYSLGVCLYEMLTGHPPYTANDPVALAIKHVSAPIPHLPSTLDDFQQIINKSMAKRPGARFRTATEFLAALDDLQSTINRPIRPLEGIGETIVRRAKSTQRHWRYALHQLKQIQLSKKHGLIVKNSQRGYDLPDIDALEKTIKTLRSSHTDTPQTLDTTILRDDSIALAIEAEQAKILLSPRWLVVVAATTALLIGVTALIVEPSIFGADAMKVRYVD
ncbi:Serine/threonine-protein kinase PrkC [BD1-7 clade bacterium]|uniref:Serine/threonine-protein kinase PrkC n=1 Tax=BD1-7 clade bacterium TaxID=2029982 RepID=A0A5S9QL59_9GAMM|nr:Serine/threonine-protein kinase PrkC [BD1-7 clade bacterium]CAA0120648.1 Serine/threonine-protein kinase PrkC [BD1-7 clade bacterium]